MDFYTFEEFNQFIKDYKIGAELIQSITNELSNYKPKNLDFFDAFTESLKEYYKTKKEVSKSIKEFNLDSKKTQSLGKDFDEELAKGIDSSAGKVEKAAENLAKKTKNKLKINLGDLFYEENNTAPNIKSSKINGSLKNINKYTSGNSNVFQRDLDEIITKTGVSVGIFVLTDEMKGATQLGEENKQMLVA